MKAYLSVLPGRKADGILHCTRNARDALMKTATIPCLWVDPERPRSAETFLHKGESLLGLVEQAIRLTAAHRRAGQARIASGLAARDQARQTGRHVEACAS